MSDGRTALILLLVVGMVAIAFVAGVHHQPDQRVCFSSSAWSADDGQRPCVEVTHVEEDGSFGYRVSDADGAVRYSAGLGALDR